MATNNAINSNIPIEIAKGGTNASSMTNTDGVVYYDGTRLVTTAVGSATQVLTSNGAGLAPTFQPAAGGVTGPGTSTDRAIATWNGAGGTALFDNSTVKIDSTGRMTNTTQPAFQAYLGTSDLNVTGDGTNYLLGSGNALTIVVNQGTNFTTGGTFTAPVTGQYFFYFAGFLMSVGAGHTTLQLQITTTGNTFNGAYINPGAVRAAGNFLGQNMSIFCPMTAGDTATFNIIVSGSTKTIGIDGNQGLTFCGGYLVC